MGAPQHVIAVIGGATAGAETAALLADQGVAVVVFEQNARPYGKVEDGLPRWHVKLREKEYLTVDEKLDRPGVSFLPLTALGRDVDFRTLTTEWGFTAVILAVGAWRDRPLAIDDADRFIGKGLIYQNPLIHWFNHYEEPGYDGPQYQLADGAIVIGGGLASIDVVKVLQLEIACGALRQRGIKADVIELEHLGIPDALKAHGLTWESLGLTGATLFYRRRIEDMPLTEIPPDSAPARRQKQEAVRVRIVRKAMEKYRFRIQPHRLPVGLLTDGDRLAGIRFQQTRIHDGKVVPIDGAFEEVRSPLVISSIGSIPVPIPGIPQRGEVYDYTDYELGRIAGYDTVFGAGNALTGKGNILESRKHGIAVATHVIEHFLGIAEGDHAGEEAALDTITGPVDEAVERISSWVRGRPRLTLNQVEGIMRRVRARQETVGYNSYRAWMEQGPGRMA